MPAANTAARPAQFDKSSQHRRSMIAKVQIGAKTLAVDEDDYRQAIFDASGQMSLAACSDAELIKMLDWLKSKGFKPMAKKGVAMHPMARKARALWISLHHLNAVHNPSEAGLEAFAKRQLNCEKLVWARQSDGYRLIEALKAMAVRHGWQQFDRSTGRPFTPIGLQNSLCCAILIKLKDAGIAPAAWTLDQTAFRLCGIETGGTTSGYTADDYERLAKALGDKLRKHAPAVTGHAA